MSAIWPIMLALTREGARGVEYSIDPAADGSAFTVGFERLTGQFNRVAQRVSFAAEWAWMLERFVAETKPTRFLLRVDTNRHDDISALTAYCRFPFHPKTDQFNRSLAAAWPWEWGGVSAETLADTLGVEGPNGVAFRASAGDSRPVATYFDLKNTPRADHQLERLFELLGWSPEGRSNLEAALKPLYAAGPRGVVGFDGGDTEGISAVKFNPPNVPLDRAWDFFAKRGSPVSGISRVRAMGEALRARWLTYLGVKLGAAGKISGRAYFSVRPDWVPGPLAPAFISEREAVPAYRLPHF